MCFANLNLTTIKIKIIHFETQLQFLINMQIKMPNDFIDMGEIKFEMEI